MEILLFLASIIALLIFLSITHHFTKEIIKSKFKEREIPLVLIGISQLVYSIILLLWSLDNFSFNIKDYVVIFSSIISIETIALTFIIYNFSKNKKVLYPLFSYLLIIPLIYSASSNIHLVIPVSFFIIIISFILFSDLHKKVNQALLLYASISLIGYFLSILKNSLIPTLNLVSIFFFLLFIHLLMKALRSKSEFKIIKKFKEKSPLISFLKHFIFVIILTNFIFIGTIGTHEIGHVASSKYLGCKDARIVLSLNNMPHTETTCSDESIKTPLILGGILPPLIISFLLLFSGGKFIKEISLQIISFNLIISYKDLILLGFSDAIATSMMILGIAICILSIGLLAKSKTF